MHDKGALTGEIGLMNMQMDCIRLVLIFILIIRGKK